MRTKPRTATLVGLTTLTLVATVTANPTIAHASQPPGNEQVALVNGTGQR